jgi:hypothetical protein
MVSGVFGENYCAQTIQQNGGIYAKRKHSDRPITLEGKSFGMCMGPFHP